MAAVANVSLVDGGDVLVDDCAVALTAYEHRVLAALLRAGPSIVLSKVALEDALYGDAARPAASNVVQVLVSRVRKTLRQAGAKIEIRAIRRRGYRLAVLS